MTFSFGRRFRSITGQLPFITNFSRFFLQPPKYISFRSRAVGPEVYVRASVPRTRERSLIVGRLLYSDDHEEKGFASIDTLCAARFCWLI